MKFKVVVSNYWIGRNKHRRGDIVEMSELDAKKHGTKLEAVNEPLVKPKRKRRTKAEMEAAREKV